MKNLHADHMDTTGAYAQKYKVVNELFQKGMLENIPEEFLPPGANTKAKEVVPVEQSGEATTTTNDSTSSWKSFLQNIIAEEKSKLNI